MKKIGRGKVYSTRAAAKAVAKLIKQSDAKIAFATTGGGSGIGSLLVNVPGVSKILYDVSLPYGRASFNRLVGRDWKASTGNGYCSLPAATALTQATFMRMQEDVFTTEGPGRYNIIAVGLSAAIPTSRLMKSGTRLHAAVRTPDGLFVLSLKFNQRRFTRQAGNELCDIVALNLVLTALGHNLVPLNSGLPFTLKLGRKLPNAKGGCLPIGWINDKIGIDLTKPVFIGLDGTVTPAYESLSSERHLVFPGSHNPPTFGHDFVAQNAKRLTKKEVVFEISAANADKGGVSDAELWRRASLLVGRHPIILSRNLPLFADKAAAYNHCSFAVGGDTADRILRAKYYGGKAGMFRALRHFAQQDTRFYTMTRALNGVTYSTETLRRRAGQFRDLFPTLDVTVDVSSTELRNPPAPKPETK
jgi:hypothetical protein